MHFKQLQTEANSRFELGIEALGENKFSPRQLRFADPDPHRNLEYRSLDRTLPLLQI